MKDGYNGYLVKARNSVQIADKVNYLLADDDLREKMGQRAHEIVKEKYTWEIIAKRFERIYEKFAYSTQEYLRIVKGSPHNNKNNN